MVKQLSGCLDQKISVDEIPKQTINKKPLCLVTANKCTRGAVRLFTGAILDFAASDAEEISR